VTEFYLIDIGGTGLAWTVRPGWGLSDAAQSAEALLRTHSGVLHISRWERHAGTALPLSRVDSSFRGAVEAWWRSRAALAWVEAGPSGPRTALVRIGGAAFPLARREKPLGARFAGTVRLEGIAAGEALRGAPLILDHPRYGTLDTHNLLL
jgi:hypothetical protein